MLEDVDISSSSGVTPYPTGDDGRGSRTGISRTHDTHAQLRRPREWLKMVFPSTVVNAAFSENESSPPLLSCEPLGLDFVTVVNPVALRQSLTSEVGSTACVPVQSWDR